jgi:hypothetical protein
MYSFYMLFALIALWAQVRCLQDGRWRYWVAFAFGSAALFYNEYFGVMQVAAQVCAFVAILWMRRRTPSGRRSIKRAVVTAGLLIVLVAPILPYFYQQFSRSAGHPLNGGATGGGSGSLSVYNFLVLFNWAAFGYHSNAVMADLNALWPVIMLLVLVMLGRGFHTWTALVAWCIAVPSVMLFVAALYQPNLFEIRYVAGVVPLVVVLAAILVARTTRRGATVAITGVLVLASVIGLADQQYDWSNPRLFDFRNTVAWVAERYRAGDLVEYGPDGIEGVIRYYAGSMPAQLASANGEPAGKRRLFLLIVPPLYGTDMTAESVTIYQAERGRKLIGRYHRANVDVWEFQ